MPWSSWGEDLDFRRARNNVATMSTAAVELWEQIVRLAPDDRAELISRLVRSDTGTGWPDTAPAGAFAGMDTREEIAELNALARSSTIKLPPDLE